MNPWRLRIIVLILAVALLPLIISGTASLITNIIHGAAAGIHSILRPLSMSGDARLEGLIKLCLYLISVMLLVRFLFERGGGSK